MTLEKQTGRKKKIGCLLIPGMIAGIFILLVIIGAILIVGDPVEKVDAAVILSGDDGDRLEHALVLSESDFFHKLVITNTSRTTNARLRQEAISGGFDRSDIYFTSSQVNSTYDEAKAVLELAQNKGWQKLMVITDPFHSLRTSTIFRDVFRGSEIEIAVHPVAGHWFRASTWFMTSEGWRYTILEYTKLFSYLIGIK